MNNFKELKVWQQSIELATAVYKETDAFPKTEIYGITSQLRRSAVSIPSNIAEGAGRGSKKEFNQFLSIALGSSFELETQLTIAKEIGYSLDQSLFSNLSHIQNMIFKLKQSLIT